MCCSFVCVCVCAGGMCTTRRDGRKKETSEAIISGRVVAVSLGVCVLSLPPSPSLLFIYFVISDSSDMANTQLRPITVYRLLMSSHFDKLLNLK